MTEFIFKYKGVKVLPDLEQPELIRKIHLQGSKLYDISSITKNQYPELIDYEISKHNHIKEIVLLESKKIERICIHTNKLTQLKNIDLLKTNFYTNLKYLHISGMNLKDMVIFQGNHLQTLNLSNNKIKLQSNHSFQLPKLKHLDLSINKLNLFPHLKAPLLQYYDISSNQIENCSNFQNQSFEQLQFLDFSCNFIRQLPRVSLPSLKVLNKTNIKYINFRITNLKQCQEDFYPNIQELYLDNHLIKQIPILKCNQKLRILNFSRNMIFKFQKQLFPYLKQLFLQHNQLSAFPLIDIPQIEVLQIKSNLIKLFPQLNTPKLIRLNISYNRLQNIRQFAMGEYPLLVDINFKQNQIEYLPKFNAVSLKFINLQDNCLKDMEQFASIQYVQLTTLKMGINNVQISKNKLFLNLPYINAPKLQFFEANNASISDMTKFLQGSYPKLTNLSLQANKPIDIVPQVKTPQLVQVNWGQIKDITQFLQGNYPYLRQLIFQAINTLIISSPKKQNQQFQQVYFNDKGKIQIKKIPYIRSLINNLSVIKIDIQMTTNTQFLSYINLDNIKEIQFDGLDKTKIMKSLAKVNFKENKSLIKIKIIQNAHQIQKVMFQKNRKNFIFIEIDQISWRRMYINYPLIQWRFQIKVPKQFNCMQYFYSNQFVQMLNGTKMRKITDANRKRQCDLILNHQF